MDRGGQDRIVDKMIYGVDRVDRLLSGVLAAVGSVILVIWLWVIGVNFIGRGFFQLSWMFVEEYTKFFNLLLMCFGASYALRTGAHIRVELAANYLHGRGRLILECLTTLLSIWILKQIVSRFVDWSLRAFERGEVSLDVGTPMGFIYLIPVIGFGVLIFGLLVHLLRTLVQVVRGDMVKEKGMSLE